ncbi:Ig-like protein, group 1 [uncultured Paraglaciecola sp.]|uniref:Ig-like protein, group 1 n=1 Tax=uncultured Paraglaciecola sp. TaxID=1765024 RepID=UPI00260CCC7D|nr:Ig-like protein, group 1 [uncultured Paraglaciecola sp.]
MGIRILFFASFLTLFGLSGCGGVSGENGSDPFNNEQSATSSIIKIGFFTPSGEFIEGKVGVSMPSENGVFEISAGGSIGLNIALVDTDNQPVPEAYVANFSSNCVIAQQAVLNTDLSTVNGEATSTYTDQGCAGASGAIDQITVTVETTTQTLTATEQISIRPEVIGGISFLSAIPESLVLQGASDISASHSTVSFVVSNDRNAPLANQEVEFSITSNAGNLSLESYRAISDENGVVSTKLMAGTAPVSVRVNAKVVAASGETIRTQSEALSITTGLPNQRSFTLSADVLNPEAGNYNGEIVSLTARLSDTFSNPVPNNTLVTFTAEGGTVESNCVTTDGACSVTWISGEPRPADGRVTILATAIGHETLFDSNGNNVFDDEDGGAIAEDPQTDSGFGVTPAGQTGFVDYSEAWLDDNENLQWDPTERFLDYNNNQQFDEADTLFNGTQCQATDICGQGAAATLQVRKSLVLVMSGSALLGSVFDNNDDLYASNNPDFNNANVSIAADAKHSFTAVFTDNHGQVPAFGSNVSITSSAGTVTDISSTVIPNTNKEQAFTLSFAIENTESAPVTATVKVSITSAKGIVSTVSFTVDLL